MDLTQNFRIYSFWFLDLKLANVMYGQKRMNARKKTMDQNIDPSLSYGQIKILIFQIYITSLVFSCIHSI